MDACSAEGEGIARSTDACLAEGEGLFARNCTRREGRVFLVCLALSQSFLRDTQLSQDQTLLLSMIGTCSGCHLSCGRGACWMTCIVCLVGVIWLLCSPGMPRLSGFGACHEDKRGRMPRLLLDVGCNAAALRVGLALGIVTRTVSVKSENRGWHVH
ncbi:hypothetical protein CDL15_Pgr026217 [Punica granatum]|uniref:Uncharacterized protein n=1 Tax=Punica granatum TaxID=22663 RepID=A0A218VRR5_PUNGR|nr:hypothetical protein CDL15_Pgr026217 [Punica granatum]